MTKRLPGWIIVLLLLPRFASLADTIHVHALEGNDTHPGSHELPLRTIQKALSKAKPGDTILLVPGQPPIRPGTQDHQLKELRRQVADAMMRVLNRCQKNELIDDSELERLSNRLAMSPEDIKQAE